MAKTIKVAKQDRVSVLSLNNGVTNAISPQMVKELSAALEAIQSDSEGLVLCGGEKFFSIGLDLPALIELDQEAMASFWEEFNQLVLDLYTFPLPAVCAVAGHAVAGGNILALTSDYRFAVSESRKIGLNEITLGIPVPFLPDMLLKQVVGERRAIRMMYSGGFMSLADAEAIGLVDELHPAERLQQAAVEKVVAMAKLEPEAFAAIKANYTEPIRQRYLQDAAAQNAAFLNCWFSDQVQVGLREAAKNF